jgi:2-desacetyl-2-hydroxyethyl bacteriochlorophyllide A dehydrogenase
MLAAVYHGPNDLRVEERPQPSIAEGELLIRIESASICATDIRILKGSHRKFPLGTVRIPGHEIVGTVVRAPDVPGARFEEGQRVFIAPNIGCGACPQCRRGKNNLCPEYRAFGITMDGAFAEYMRIDQAAIEQGNVIPIPPDLDAVAISLAEPFSCVLHGQEALSIGPSDTVLIQGAGPIGLMHVMLAKRRGAKKVLVSDISTKRLKMAEQLGADRAIDVSKANLLDITTEETQGFGIDAIVVATAAPGAIQQAIDAAAIGARINFFAGLPKERPAVEIDANIVHYRELILTGTTGCSTADCRAAAELVSSGAIDLSPLVSARFPLSDALRAFEAAQDSNNFKIVIEPAGEAGGNQERLRD